MNVDFRIAISIASLYLTLVGLLSAFFFVHLSQWLNGITGTEAKWKQVRGLDLKGVDADKGIACYYEAAQSSSWWTLVGWATITTFLIIVLTFLEILRRSLQPGEADVILRFVTVPCLIFLTIYVVLSVIMLFRGYGKAREVFRQVGQAL